MNDQEYIRSIKSSYTVNQIDYQIKLLTQRKLKSTNVEEINSLDHSIQLFKQARRK